MNERQRELKRQYRETRPDMGIFVIRSTESKKAYLHAAQDLRGTMNGALVRLNSGMHPNLELQREWTRRGADGFTMEIMERLPYDKDEAKTDYTEELRILEMLSEEKLQKEGYAMYIKRLSPAT